MNGVTKAWRNPRGERWLTFREGGAGPLTFTIALGPGLVPRFVYIALRIRSRWFRWHKLSAERAE